MKEKIFKLITESKEPVQIIKESYDSTKPLTLKFRGIYAVSDKENGNGRTYPYELLKNEIDRFRVEMIDTARGLQELEHPSSSEISPDRACARILSMEEDNKCWIGESVVLCSDEKFNVRGTPMGDVLASLIQYGTNFGVSTRALGEVGDDGLVSDLHLITADVVCNPSISEMVSSDGNRFVNGILESKQWICNIHGQLVESKIEKLEKAMEKSPNTFISSKKSEYAAKAFADFLKDIRGM